MILELTETTLKCNKNNTNYEMNCDDSLALGCVWLPRSHEVVSLSRVSLCILPGLSNTMLMSKFVPCVLQE
eukprot:5198831-Amphidinium_carterae.1